MTQEQILTMSKYYEKRYGKPINDNDAIKKLITIYDDLFGEPATQTVRDAIAEYYRIISSRDLPAYEWILEALHVTSKKDKEKRNFPYCVGMLRSWLKYGFGHIPNQEEDEIVEYFEEITGCEMTLQARRVLQNLMGKYGAIKVTRMLNELKDQDKAYMLMLYLQKIMDNKYEVNKSKLDKQGNIPMSVN